MPQVNGVLGLSKQPLDPNAMAYASIIKSYASVGDEGGAEDVLRRLKEKNIKPDVVMYNALLSAYATNGNWQVRPHTPAPSAYPPIGAPESNSSGPPASLALVSHH